MVIIIKGIRSYFHEAAVEAFQILIVMDVFAVFDVVDVVEVLRENGVVKAISIKENKENYWLFEENILVKEKEEGVDIIVQVENLRNEDVIRGIFIVVRSVWHVLHYQNLGVIEVLVNFHVEVRINLIRRVLHQKLVGIQKDTIALVVVPIEDMKDDFGKVVEVERIGICSWNVRFLDKRENNDVVRQEDKVIKVIVIVRDWLVTIWIWTS